MLYYLKEIVSGSGFLRKSGLLADQLGGVAGAVAVNLHEEAVRLDLGDIGLRLAGVGLDGAFRGGADRELEALHGAVAEKSVRNVILAILM